MAWWSAALSNLGGWLVNPAVFLIGAALIAVPILIHLLNQRKFKIVDWAAMDFLLEADQKNRRRVHLENLLLLLLRCLAVFVLALLLARPFDSSGLIAKITDTRQFERVILVDDSYSMWSSVGNRSAMEAARERLIDLVRAFAEEQSENTLTLMLASQPDRPQFNAVHLTAENVEEIIERLDRLEATERSFSIDAALQELDRYLAAQAPNVNRVAYIVTDMRRRDWPVAEETSGAGEGAASAGPAETLRKISKTAKGCIVIDAADEDDRNLSIREIRSEKTLAAGVDSRFEIVASNHGSQPARNVRLKVTVGESVPLVREIEVIEPRSEVTETFQTSFARDEAEDRAGETQYHRLKVELSTAEGGEDDRLALDSRAFFAARVVPGIPTLLVDGDPSAAFGKAETFYLKRALAPPGKFISGVAPEIISEAELETTDFSKYQVIFICNVYRLSEKTLEELRRWVEAGGGLVFMPGDQVDEEAFNASLYGTGEEEGKLLSPLRLESLAGDEQERSWVNFKVEDERHPVLAGFAGQQNPILSGVKVFRWWKAKVKQVPGMQPANVLAKFSDVDESPALVERPLGKGRVVAATVPADAAWGTWASDPSYILIMQELVRYLAPGEAKQNNFRLGDPLKMAIDLRRYEPESELTSPGERKTSVQAAQVPGSSDASQWLLEARDTSRQGFYDVKLARRDAVPETAIFAGNLDPAEGDLRKADLPALKRTLKDANVEFVSGAVGLGGASGAQTEIWRYLLWLLIAVLLGEQALGWFFGLRR